MSRKTTELRNKVHQMQRNGVDGLYMTNILPSRVVKGQGVRCGWRKTDHGFERFAPRNTNLVCTLPTKEAKFERLSKRFK